MKDLQCLSGRVSLCPPLIALCHGGPPPRKRNGSNHGKVGLVVYCLVLEEQFFEFPEAVEYLHVSYISEAEASLYEILVHTEAALEQMRDSGSVIILGTELTQLLNCAKMYPPAWVLALEAASTGTQKAEDLESILIGNLRKHLAGQHFAPYFLAKAMSTHDDVIQGLYYWIIEHNPKTAEVNFVSGDYQSVWAKADLFNLPRHALDKVRRPG